MKNISLNSMLVLLALFFVSSHSHASDQGFFRTIPVETPLKGTMRISNTSFYSSIPINSVLERKYSVTDNRIFSNFTDLEMGITDHIALKGTLPFYADLFSQGNKSGEKTGPGDIAVGLHMSFLPNKRFFRGFGISAGVCIPEEFGYGDEPLGLRTFSTGELSYNADMSFTFNMKFAEGHLSTVFHWLPNAEKSDKSYPEEVFYNSGYGYLGIGKSDDTGLSPVIFQNHATVSLGTAIPFNSWLSCVFEMSLTTFIEKPERDTIVSAAPGIRLGRPEGVHLNIGMDSRIKGSIPDRTYMMRINVPFFHPTVFKVPMRKELIPEGMFRSRNSLVAVTDFSRSDITYLNHHELKEAFFKKLSDMEIMDVTPPEKMEKAFARVELVPRKDSPGRIGVRLGANFLINTDISQYTVKRNSSSTVPYVIGFPKTTFSLSARASVTDLVAGTTHDLGDITARVERSRGVNLFPQGDSSDIVYISEPERRRIEKELIDHWVSNFNNVILQRLDIFGWNPKHDKTRGDQDVKG